MECRVAKELCVRAAAERVGIHPPPVASLPVAGGQSCGSEQDPGRGVIVNDLEPVAARTRLKPVSRNRHGSPQQAPLIANRWVLGHDRHREGPAWAARPLRNQILLAHANPPPQKRTVSFASGLLTAPR